MKYLPILWFSTLLSFGTAVQAGTPAYCPGTTYNSNVTWYDHTVLGLGNCSYSKPTNPQYFAALATHLYNQNYCGLCAEITSVGGVAPGTKIIAMITDQCPIASNPTHCYNGSNHLDLNIPAFRALNNNNTVQGVFSVTWQVVPCPSNLYTSASNNGANMTYLWKDGTNQWYSEVQIRDHPHKITQVQWGGSATGPWNNLAWQTYNYWLTTSGMGTGPIYLRIVDATGAVIITGNIQNGYTPQANGDSTAATAYRNAGGQFASCAGPAFSPTRTRTPDNSTPTRTPTRSPTPTRTPIPVDCPTAFNTGQTLTVNGTWAGFNATHSAAPFTGSTGNAVRVQITSPLAYNSQMANLSGFTPTVLGGYTRMSMKVYVDPANLPWSGASTYHQFRLRGTSSSSGKYEVTLGSADVPLVAGLNDVSFALTFPGGAAMAASDIIGTLHFILNQDGQQNGVLFIDEITLHTDAACPPSSPTGTATRTGTRTATRTATPSATPTRTPTPTATRSPTRTATPTASPTRTATPTELASTATFTRTATRSSTPTSSPTRTGTPTRSRTATPSITLTFTEVPVDSTATSTFTRSPTSTVTATSTGTPTDGPSATASETPLGPLTATPTWTPVDTLTATPSSTPSPAATATATPTPSPTPSITLTATDVPPGSTSTATPSVTATATPSLTPTATPSLTTVVHSPTFTPVVPAVNAPPAGVAGAAYTLGVSGSNFQSGAVVWLDGTAYSTTFVSPTSLQANLPALGAGTYSLTVVNPNGFQSAPQSLVISGPAVTATAEPGPLEFEEHRAWPNPAMGGQLDNVRIAVKLKGAADKLTLKLYTRAMTVVGIQELGPQGAGWRHLRLPDEFLQSAGNGTYFYVVSGERGQAKTVKNAVGSLTVIR